MNKEKKRSQNLLFRTSRSISTALAIFIGIVFFYILFIAVFIKGTISGWF